MVLLNELDGLHVAHGTPIYIPRILLHVLLVAGYTELGLVP